MSRIVFVTNSLEGGGAERVVLTLAEQMQKMGHYVHLILMYPIFEAEVNFELPIDVLGYKKKSFFNAQRLEKLVTQIEKEHGAFDLVLSHLPETDKVVKSLNHPNTYYCIHTTFSKAYIENKGWLKKLRRLRRFRKMYSGENIIAVSDGVRHDLIQTIKINPKSIHTIHNPIDLGLIRKLSMMYIPSAEYENYIVHIGNYGAVKRHDILIQAYKASKIDLKLVLIGKNVKKNVEDLVKTLNLEEQIIFTEFLPNPFPILKNAKMLIVSSDFEGFPMVIPEALALGVEVISTDCDSGPREILVGALASNLVPTADILLMAEKMKEVALRKMTNTPRDYSEFVAPFESEIVAKRYLNLIK